MFTSGLWGVALRSPQRKCAAVVARWAALREALPRAQAASASLGFPASLDAQEAELETCRLQLRQLGVETSGAGPQPTPDAHSIIDACPLTQALRATDVLATGCAYGGRARLQGKCGRILDLLRLASIIWKAADAPTRRHLHEVSGPGDGVLWSDYSRDER